MASFHGKIGWKRQRKRESKNYRFITFLPNQLEKIPKKKKKKFKKYNYCNISSQNRQEKAGKERKQKLSFHYVPTQPIRENSKKYQKNSKNTIMTSFQAKIGWKRLRNRENKNYRYVLFLSDGQENIPKKQQKNSKN